MSRSGYSDDYDDTWALVRWRGAVNQAIKGRRGQSMLRELVHALDAMPEKWLGAGALVTEDGECCALGALGLSRGMDLTAIDDEDRDAVAEAFGIAGALAAEIMYLNDDTYGDRLPVNFDVCGPMRRWESHRQIRWVANKNAGIERWRRMREWAVSNLKRLDKSGQKPEQEAA